MMGGDQNSDESEPHLASAIWCLTARDGLIIAGCGNGRIEVNIKILNLPIECSICLLRMDFFF